MNDPLKVYGSIFAIIILWLFFRAGCNNDNTKNTSDIEKFKTMYDASSPIEIGPGILYDEYQKNEVAADKKYKLKKT